MQPTPRLGLKRPDGTDPFLRMDFVNNYNTIDQYPGTLIIPNMGARPTSWGANQVGMSVWQQDTRQEWRFMGGTEWHLVNPVERMIGEITMYVSGTIPSGWLLCDGTDKPKSSYPLLSSVLGTTYGAPADPSTFFRLPNLQSRFPLGGAGVGSTTVPSGLTVRNPGQTLGRERHVLDITEMPVHPHTATSDGAGAHTPTGGTGFDDRRHQHAESAEGWRNGAGASYVFLKDSPVSGAPWTGGGWYYMTTDSRGASGRPATEATNDYNLHAHPVTLNAIGDHTHGITVNAAGGSGGITQAHENMPPSLVVNFLIKY